MVTRVLFVCTGNICRSPTAEAVFRARAAGAGLADEIDVDSAGTGNWHVGEAPDPRAMAAAARRGLDLSDQCARQVRTDDFRRFDLVVALDRGHARVLDRLKPADSQAKLVLLLDFAPELGISDVPDPYMGGPEGFERVLDMIERAADGLLAAMRAGAV